MQPAAEAPQRRSKGEKSVHKEICHKMRSLCMGYEISFSLYSHLQSISKLASGSQTLQVISRPTIMTLRLSSSHTRQGSRGPVFQSDKPDQNV
jgi:hypothetical protein